jgi:polar amino acid transport system permease protein
MTPFQVIRHVVLPQALMRVIPPLGVEFINVIKNSSIAMTISVTELTFQTQQIESLTFRGFEAATAITLLYVLLALTIVLLMAAIERVVRLDLRVG